MKTWLTQTEIITNNEQTGRMRMSIKINSGSQTVKWQRFAADKKRKKNSNQFVQPKDVQKWQTVCFVCFCFNCRTFTSEPVPPAFLSHCVYKSLQILGCGNIRRYKLAEISHQTAKAQCNKCLDPFLKRFKNACKMRRSKLLNVQPLTALCLFFVRACFIQLSPLLFMTWYLLTWKFTIDNSQKSALKWQQRHKNAFESAKTWDNGKTVDTVMA